MGMFVAYLTYGLCVFLERQIANNLDRRSWRFWFEPEISWVWNNVSFPAVSPRSHVPVFDLPGADRTGESTAWNFKTSPVLTGRSNDRERSDQAVVHAQWSAVDHNSIIALFLLYRRR